MRARKTINKKHIEIIFSYDESCNNVYKQFTVLIDNKKSNIKGLLKYITNDYPSILTANTYFWRPSGSAGQRRSKEKYYENIVIDYFRSEGFIINGETTIAEKRMEKMQELELI